MVARLISAIFCNARSPPSILFKLHFNYRYEGENKLARLNYSFKKASKRIRKKKKKRA
jgi:hypothetical protein